MPGPSPLPGSTLRGDSMLGEETQEGQFYLTPLKPDGSRARHLPHSVELPYPSRVHPLIQHVISACNTCTGPGEEPQKRPRGCLPSGSTQYCEGPGERTLCCAVSGLPLELTLTKQWGHRSKGCFLCGEEDREGFVGKEPQEQPWGLPVKEKEKGEPARGESASTTRMTGLSSGSP